MILNDNAINLEEWVELISSPKFFKLKEKLDQRVKTLEVQIKRQSEQLNLDGGISLLVLHARKDEVESLLSSFEFYQKELKKLNGQAQKG